MWSLNQAERQPARWDKMGRGGKIIALIGEWKKLGGVEINPNSSETFSQDCRFESH